MQRSRRTRGIVAMYVVAAALCAAVPVVVAHASPATSSSSLAGGPDAMAVTAPLRNMKVIKAPPGRVIPAPHLPRHGAASTDGGWSPSIAAQAAHLAATAALPSTSTNFEGINNLDGVMPPDSNGDVGPHDYVQWVNVHLQVYDKTTHAGRFASPIPGNQIWAVLSGSLCSSTNNGDPIVLYDPMADRWLLSQLAFATDSLGNPVGPFAICVAVSTTGDPTGSYTAYQYTLSSTLLPDYPKWSVWPDGYYLTVNDFDASKSFAFAGAGVFVFDRTRMLAGQTAGWVSPGSPIGGGTTYGGLLPATLNGWNLPPAGSSAYVASIDDTGTGSQSDTFRIWKIKPNFSTSPASVVMSGPTNLPITGFTTGVGGIPQGDSRTKPLDPLDDRAMYRLNYRNFGDHESLVVNHTVEVATNQAGVRWFEVRDPGGTPTVYQQSTYAPDTTSRWMGSVNMDHSGDMALGFSAASTTVYPSIRWTARLAGDPLNTMAGDTNLGTGESTIAAGSSWQYNGPFTSNPTRWGDYSSMSIDPTDDCTFWYTNEYIGTQNTRGPAWQTRIASFRLPQCTSPRASISPPALTFGDTAVGATSAAQNVTITNPGNGPLTVRNVAFGGTNVADFSTSATLPVTVPPGGSTVIPVSFAPTATGTRTATLSVSDDASLYPQIVPLSGAGTNPAPVISGFVPGSGLPGMSVVISGSGFTGATGVGFNGTAAVSFTVDSDAQVTATVPVGATSGPITVTTGAGTATSVGSFTVGCAAGQWLAQFYPNQSLSGVPVASTCEASISHNWGTAGPGVGGLGGSNYSVRWTQTVSLAGTYVFTATGDDGIRVLVDNSTLIDGWVLQGPTTYTASAVLAAGSHPVEVDYFQAGGGAVAQFSYANIGPACTSGQWLAQFYPNQSLSGVPVASTCEASINHNWGTAGPGVGGLGGSNYSVRWTQTVSLAGDVCVHRDRG